MESFRLTASSISLIVARWFPSPVQVSRMLILSTLALISSAPLSAQWMQTQFASSATANCFLAGSGFVIAGTSGGVYRSSDNGLTWTVASAGLTNMNVTCLATDGGETFAGTYGGGVFRSTDNGGSWAPVSAGLPDLYVTALTFHGGALFASVFEGVFRTYNFGTTWTSAGLEVRVSQFAEVGSTLFAGTAGWGVCCLDSDGQWRSVHGGAIISALEAVGTDLFTVDQFVYRSTDLGANWTYQSNGISQSTVSILASAGGTLFAAGPGDGVWSSTDRAGTWSYTGADLTDRYVYALGSIGTALFAGTPGKIWMLPLSLPPANLPYSWVQAGMSGESVNCLALLPNGCIVAGTQSGLIYTSTDNGGGWVQGNTVLDTSGITALAADSAGSIFAGTQRSGVYHSTDNGVSWHQNNSGLTFARVSGIKVGPGTAVLAVGGEFDSPEPWGAVFRSEDHGEHWTKLGVGVAGTAFVALGISPKTGTMIVSSGSGKYYRSSDSGATWSEVSLPEGWTGMCIEGMANGWFFAGSSGGGVYRSTDNGATWTLTHAGTVQALCFNALGHVVEGLANSDGVRVSVDSGATFTPVNVGLVHRWVRALLTLPSGHILAGTTWGGVYRTMRSTTSVRESSSGMVGNFRLQQNYPNPFNPTTTIHYSLPHRSHVTLIVFNPLGQKEAELINGEIDPGDHSVQFDATNLASGVYFYRLQVGSYVQTRSLCVLR